MIPKRTLKRILTKAFKQKCGPSCDYRDVVEFIVNKVPDDNVGHSSYAKRRRSKWIGRCPRCYRVIGITRMTDTVVGDLIYYVLNHITVITQRVTVQFESFRQKALESSFWDHLALLEFLKLRTISGPSTPPVISVSTLIK